MRGTTADYSAQAISLVKGDSEWKPVAANGWDDSWPGYDQNGVTINSKIYFFGMFMLICKGIFPYFLIRW